MIGSHIRRLILVFGCLAVLANCYQPRFCSNTSPCIIGNYCDTDSQTCKPGCLRDENCPSGKVCQQSLCQDASICQSQAYKGCVGKQLYWLNSCNKAEQLIKSCPGGCSNGACSQVPTNCNNNGLCDNSQGETCANCPKDCSCGPGQICDATGCKSGQCSSNKQCKAGQLCVASICRLFKCKQDTDCQAPYKCVGGSCSGCAFDKDCADDEQCVSGVCQYSPPITKCQNDSDCGSGQRCSQGICTGVCFCKSDTDCNPGYICDGCACIGCDSDSDCQSGYRCINNQCAVKPPPAPSCRSDSDCQSGATCQNGNCVPGTPPCMSDNDCQSGYVCASGVCKFCPCQEGAKQCRSAYEVEVCVSCQWKLLSQCSASVGPCSNGECTKKGSCRSDRDCPTGGFCDTKTLTCCECKVGTVKCQSNKPLPDQVMVCSNTCRWVAKTTCTPVQPFCKDGYCQSIP